MTSREAIKLNEVRLGEESLLIAGDAAARPLEFSGLNKQIVTNSGNVTFLTASGVGNFAQSLFGIGADPTLLYTSARQLQALGDSIQTTSSIYQVNVPGAGTPQGVVGGLSISSIVNPVTGSLIDIKPSRYVGYGGFLLTERSEAGEVWIESEELIPMSRVDVASSNFSYISFVIEMMALKVIGESMQAKFTVGA